MKSMHYWRLHARVTRAIWAKLSIREREIIAADSAHETELYKWYATKVDADTLRLYEDPTYYDNDPSTFRYGRTQSLALAA